MAKADCVYSTPRTNTPVDTTRRRFLTVAAIGSMIGAGSLAAVAMTPNDVPQAATAPRHSGPDPAVALIADKLAAGIAHGEAIDAQDEADESGIGVDEADDRCWAACHAVRAILASRRAAIKFLCRVYERMGDPSSHSYAAMCISAVIV